MERPVKTLLSRLRPGRIKPSGNGSALPRSLIRDYNASRPCGSQPVLCRAPFRSVYFTRSGEALACCLNRSHVLGRWPGQSIRDIWFGKQAGLLRERIRKNDLSLGCANCLGHLRARNFDAVKAMMYDHIPANKNRFPGVMELELSNRCNLSCIMCRGEFSSAIRSGREGRPPHKSPYDGRFVAELAEFVPHLSEIKFYGGEPFLVGRYHEIWEMILETNPGLDISVQTNATVWDERVKRVLESGRFHITASLEAVEKESYERIRAGARFEQVMENIHAFARYARRKGTFFGISACVMRQNWDKIPGVLALCNRLDVPIYFHTVWHPPCCALWNLPPGRIEAVKKHLAAVDPPAATAAQQKNRRHYLDLLGQLDAWHGEALAWEKNKEELAGVPEDSLEFLLGKMEIVLREELALGREEARRRLGIMEREVTAAVEALPPSYPLDRALAMLCRCNGLLLSQILEHTGRQGLLERFLSLQDELSSDCGEEPLRTPNRPGA
ncbi:MAG: radical SAM protein [Thermodesulfobacteriota bacterium]